MNFVAPTSFKSTKYWTQYKKVNWLLNFNVLMFVCSGLLNVSFVTTRCISDKPGFQVTSQCCALTDCGWFGVYTPAKLIKAWFKK